MHSIGGIRAGSFRAYFLCFTISLAGFCFGYDSGIAGGVLTFKSFQRDFRLQPHQLTTVSSLVVGLQQAGAIVSSLCCAPLTERIGRRWAIIWSCLLFSIGVVLETIPSHSINLFYAARVIAGLGLGSAYTIAPMYSAEMAPKEIRGRLGSCLQWMYTWGIFTSYWVNYAVASSLPSTAMQWQIPIGLQMTPAGLLGLALLMQKDSMRWLAKKGRYEEAWESIKWIRADDSEEVKLEYDEILRGLQDEMQATEGLKKRELLDPANRLRLLIAFLVCLFQQSTGAAALAYFAPQFFKLLVGDGNKELLITALFGVVKVVACGLFVVFVSEQVGRKPVFVAGGLAMSTCMLITAILLKFYPPEGAGGPSPASIATIGLIFLSIAFYNFSWGPFAYTYIGEIFPSRIREIGVSVGMGSQWLFTCVYSLATPYMIEKLGWGTFLYYAIADFVMALFALFVIKETHGLSIEEMETVFHSAVAHEKGHSHKQDTQYNV